MDKVRWSTVASRAAKDANRAEMLEVALASLEASPSIDFVTLKISAAEGGAYMDSVVSATVWADWEKIRSETIRRCKAELADIEAKYDRLRTEE